MTNRPVRLTRDSVAVKGLYAAAKSDATVENILGPVMRDEVRADMVLSRIREAAQVVADADEGKFPHLAQADARLILSRIGRKSPYAARVNPDGGRKARPLSVYPSDEQKARFMRAADDEGMKLATWMLQAAEKAADEAGYPNEEEEEN